MNRKAEVFFDAITLLREDLVEEAQDYVFRKKRAGWKKFGSLAACVVLVVSLGMLAALPRGCGASGGSDNSMAAGMPQDTSGGSSGTGDSAPPPEPSADAPEEAPSQEETLQFTAQVLEVLEDGLLVEPFGSSLAGRQQVRVPTGGLEDLPEFSPGGVVTVCCGSVALEDGEAVAQDVTAVLLVEP